MTSRLLNGDCLEMLKQIENNSVDLVIADLPYGQTDCKWDSIIDMDKLWEQLKRVGKENTAFIFFCTTRFGHEIIKSNEKWFRYDLVWSKPNSKCGFLNSNKMPLRAHEMIYVFYKKLPLYNIADNHTKLPCKYVDYDYSKNSSVYQKMGIDKKGLSQSWEPRLPKSIIECNIHIKKKHPTEKPEGILSHLIKYYSKAGDTILDPTMGCGSCGVASTALGRNFIGIEMNKEYFDVAHNQLNA
jgi:site-specific DNA-methyltransferase (adenine-specific)